MNSSHQNHSTMLTHKAYFHNSKVYGTCQSAICLPWPRFRFFENFEKLLLDYRKEHQKRRNRVGQSDKQTWMTLFETNQTTTNNDLFNC